MEYNNGMEYFQDENRCKLCHKRYIDRSENPDSVLCSQCREEKIKLKVPPAIYGAAALLLILVAVAVVFFVPVLNDYAIYVGAEQKAEDGYPHAVLISLMELNEKYPDSEKIAVRSADIGMRYEFYDYASYAIETYLAGKEVSDSEYDRISGYQDRLDVYYHTADRIDWLAENYWDGVEADDPDLESRYRGFRDLIAELADYEMYDQGLACYYAASYSIDNAERLYWLERCFEASPMNYIAETEIAVILRRDGELNKARELLMHAYNINKDDALIQRAFATLEMAEGNLAKGLEHAQTAYEWYPEGNYVADTYIVALYVNGMTDEANKIKEELEAQDYYFDDEFYALLAGEMALYDYYVGY